MATDNKPHETNGKTLEQALIEACVSRAHIEITLQRRALTHESLTDIMRPSQYGFLTPERLARVQAYTAKHPYFAPSEIDAIDAQAVSQALQSSNIVIDRQVPLLPVAFDGPDVRLILACADPQQTSRAALLYPGFNFGFVVCSERTLQSIYRRYYSRSGQQALDQYITLRKTKASDPNAESALREFIMRIITHACYIGASDIAFAPMADASGGVVRYKVGSVGTIMTYLERDIWTRVCTYLINTAGVTEQIKTSPQDLRFAWSENDHRDQPDITKRYGLRVVMALRSKNISTSLLCVMRVLDQQADAAELDTLDFDQDTREYLRTVTNRATGLFLVTGPTGSGKTTTLYALLQEIDPVSRWIDSIENPIEYQRGLWMQMQTDAAAAAEGDGAHALLKALLRAAPDVLLFGEIRKQDSAIELVDAANTGHLVFSTFHTNNAALAISRMRGFGLDMTVVASLLHGILAQRLVRVLCVHCAQDDDSPKTMANLTKWGVVQRQEDGSCTYLGAVCKPQRAVGCAECAWTGFQGRKMVYELLKMTPKVRELIDSNAPPVQIAARIPRGQSLVGNGLRLVARGLTDFREIERLDVVMDEEEGRS
jgi:type II secretory ATPase GspE/PulE/Tfp pilus assembly ATPase PilB-like protein